jgi:anti-sigma factor RsiW
MTCDEAAVLVHALIDGELDASHAREVEAHATQCPRCAAELAAAREFSQAMRGNNLRYVAPPSLRASIDRTVPRPVAATTRRGVLKGFALGSMVSAAAAAGVGFVIIGNDRDGRILGDVVSAHLRSLQAEHLTDVVSSDRHTVKPWFNGRIDLAPPVIDLTAQGFTLIGGRLDFIDGKPAAALVYRRRVHVINLFVMQGASAGFGAAALGAPKLNVIQGFNILRWTGQGLNLLAVSDLAQDELEDFAAKFQSAAKAERAG